MARVSLVDYVMNYGYTPMKASRMGDYVICEVSSVEQLLGDIARHSQKLRLDADRERRLGSDIDDGLRRVQL
jgi:hypothetical protein